MWRKTTTVGQRPPPTCSTPTHLSTLDAPFLDFARRSSIPRINEVVAVIPEQTHISWREEVACYRIGICGASPVRMSELFTFVDQPRLPIRHNSLKDQDF